MPIHNHVTNYELSKRLREVGVPQKSQFYWWETDFKDEWAIFFYEELPDDPEDPIEPDRIISAFLASELGEVLPEGFGIEKEGKQFICHPPGDYEASEWARADTLPDAMGKMVVYLKENRLIEF